MKKLLLLCGRKGAGKTSLADALTHNCRTLWPSSDHAYPCGVRYSIAGPVKTFAHDCLGLRHNQLWGEEEERNTLTPYKISGLLRLVNRLAPVDRHATAREVLQTFATLFRRLDPDIWINLCLRRISADRPFLAVVDDGRFANELTRVQELGGKALLLTRNPYGSDSHESENSLPDDPAAYDAVLDNSHLDAEGTYYACLDIMEGWGWHPQRSRR